MDYQAIYQQKLKSAAEAVKVVKSGDWVDYYWAAQGPITLDRALAQRSEELTDVKIRCGIQMTPPAVMAVKDAEKHFVWNSWHMAGYDRKLAAEGKAYFIPVRYSEVGGYYTDGIPSDVMMLQVPPMDRFGYFRCGLNASHLQEVVERTKCVIVEVNENMPSVLSLTGGDLHISQVDIIVEGDNDPVPEMPAAQPDEIDQKIAQMIVDEIEDGACLQLGIGGMPNAVGTLIAQSDLKHLGVHTEMYVDGFMDMTLAGKIDGSQKSIDKGRQVFAFCAGTRKLYDFVEDNPEVLGAPVAYVNDVRVISKLDNMISINNAVNMDLFGQVNAESAGIKQISGSGGQLDYVLGAYLSRGGKSFICMSSTMKDKEGNLHSRICPTLEPGSIMTDTRANIQWVVTEYGKANLKGLATWQRAEALIGLAHPQFRDELIKEAEKMRIWRSSNKR